MLVAVVVSFSLLMVSPASSEDASIENVVITRDGDLRISFEVANAFTGEVEEAIASGILTSLAFTIELHRKRRLWFDGAVARRYFRHTVKYDTLREEYSLLREENGVESIVEKSLAVVQEAMTKVEGLQLISMAELKRGKSYRITLQAERDGAHLPFPLNRLLFFYSLGRLKTEIHVEDFVYE
ncbi:MAG: DUF4390 domain-containing protein [Thermodesulfobacteriota bacterium]